MLSGHIIPTFEASFIWLPYLPISSSFKQKEFKISVISVFFFKMIRWVSTRWPPVLCKSVLTDRCADSRVLEMQTYHPALAYCTVILFAKQSVYWHQSQARVPQWLSVVVGDLLHGNGVSGTESPLCSSSTLGCCDHGRSDRGPLFSFMSGTYVLSRCAAKYSNNNNGTGKCLFRKKPDLRWYQLTAYE